MRKGKKQLSMFLDKKLHEHLQERAKLRGIALCEWIMLAITERMKEENKYL